MPPNHYTDASATFPSQYSEPPTSDDMAYVPMSSCGPESSLAPATTSDRGELNYVYSEPSRQNPAFPSPFAVRSTLIAPHPAACMVNCLVQISESIAKEYSLSGCCLHCSRCSSRGVLAGVAHAFAQESFRVLRGDSRMTVCHAGLIWNSS